MLIIREITGRGAIKQAMKLCAYCFNDENGWTERIWPLRNHDRGWGVFEDSRLLAMVIARNFRVSLFGTVQPLSGVSCVASLPEARNRGLVRRLLEDVLKKESLDGKIFSSLHPFKFSFYEKVGFGYLGGPVVCSFSPADLRRAAPPLGEFRLFSGTRGELAAWNALYDQWVGQYSFGILSNPVSLREFREQVSWLKTRNYLYFRDNRLCGWICYSLSPTGEHTTKMSVSTMVWADEEALNALFGFLGAHRDQCAQIVWKRPSSFPLFIFTPEPRFGQFLESNYMARPLDVEAVLRLKVKRHTPADELVFSVRDTIIEKNTATYRVRGEEVLKEEFREENELPLPLFSSLLFGGISWQEASLASRTSTILPDSAHDFFRKDENIFFSTYF